jgi:hypothetical protein
LELKNSKSDRKEEIGIIKREREKERKERRG